MRAGLTRNTEEIIEDLACPDPLRLYGCYFRSLASFFNENHEKVENAIAILAAPVKIWGIRIPINVILKEHLEPLVRMHGATLVERIVARGIFKA